MRRFRFLIALSTVFLFACGGGGGGGGTSPPPAANPPPAPSNVSVARGGDGAIEVDWQGSTTASQYNVYWSSNPGVTPANGARQVATAPPAIVSGLTDGVNYYVVVTAENAAGESAASFEAQGVAGAAVPVRVTGVRATPGDGEALVEWDTQANADSYRISLDGAVVTDSPHLVTGLTNGEIYEVTVTATNSAGDGPASWRAEVQPLALPAGWTRQALIEDPSEGDSRPIALDINDSGVAAVAWLLSPGNGRQARLVVAHNVGGAWNPPVGFGILPSSVGLTVAPNGDIHLAYDIEGENVYWRRFKDGAWSDPVDIDSGALTIGQNLADLAVDDNGNVFAAWAETTPGAQTDTSDVWVRRFDAALDEWGGALVVGDLPRLLGSRIQVDTTADNRAIVAWLQQAFAFDPNGQPNRKELHASIFDGTAWTPGARIGRDNVVTDADTTEFKLDVNGSGSAVVVWAQDNENAGLPDRWEVGATRYDSATSQWLPPETIVTTDDVSRTFGPDAAMDGSGEIIAGWRNQSGADFASISDFDIGAMLWGPVASFPGQTTSSLQVMELSRESAGATIATWIENGATRKGVFVRRREAGSPTWSAEAQIGSGSRFPGLLVTTSPGGYTLVVNGWDTLFDNEGRTFLLATIYIP